MKFTSLLLCSLLYTLSVNCRAASIDNLIAEKTTGIRSEIITNIIDPCIIEVGKREKNSESEETQLFVMKSLYSNVFEEMIQEAIPIVPNEGYYSLRWRCVRNGSKGWQELYKQITCSKQKMGRPTSSMCLYP